MKHLSISLILVFISLAFNLCLRTCLAQSNTTVQGYISNKIYSQIKLKVFEIDKQSAPFIEKNFEDNSYIPFINLMIVAENDSINTFIPKETKLIGYISEIQPSKSFNRSGYFKVNFEKAICPNGKTINLKLNITSTTNEMIYNPFHHLGKMALSIAGGSITGALFSYQLGGIPLALATQGYSLAGGAAAGGFIGTISGIAGPGKYPKIEPGDELIIAPSDGLCLEQLKQISCEAVTNTKADKNEEVALAFISVKEKRDVFGDSLVKIKMKLTNNSSNPYNLNNFFLRDSQGNEYTTSITDTKEDIFLNFLPQETKMAQLEFFIEHPKAVHWLVLKDKNFNKDIGKWRINL